MDARDLDAGALFTTEATKDNPLMDIWAIEHYCMSPTVTLKNIRTGEIQSFGLGGLTAEEFIPLEVKVKGD